VYVVEPVSSVQCKIRIAVVILAVAVVLASYNGDSVTICATLVAYTRMIVNETTLFDRGWVGSAPE